MIGHQSLLSLRMAGMRPSDVWIVCLAEHPAYGQFTHPEAQIEYFGLGQYRGYPTIHVLDEEPAAALDLRCVIGTMVHICSTTRERGLAVLDRVSQFSPRKAIAAGSWGMVGFKPGLGMVEIRV